MVYVRGRDERDAVKDFHDKARRIIADGKEVGRVRSFQKRSIGNPFPPYQFPKGMGFSPEQAVLYAHRQRQTQYSQSEFQNTPFPEEPNIAETIYTSHRKMFDKGISPHTELGVAKINKGIGNRLSGGIYRGL